MEKYVHKVNYYETDKMGITHHSNYIRWMEEARVDYLDQIGFGYKKLEEEGVISPVAALECEYKSPTTFGDRIAVMVEVEEFKGVKLILRYTMTREEDGKTVFLARSTHGFLNEKGRPIILRNRFPELDAKLKELVAG